MSMIIGRKQIILAALVVALAAAIFLNWRFSQPGNGINLAAVMNTSSTLGQAAYVDNQKVASASGSGSAASATNDYFAQARLTREQNLDKAKDLLNSIATASNTTAAERSMAVSSIQAMAGVVTTEGNMESLILAKGFKACVAVVGDDGIITIVVKPKGTTDLSQSDIAQITDIVTSQTKVSADKIRISQQK